jgi:hypothetical protein
MRPIGYDRHILETWSTISLVVVLLQKIDGLEMAFYIGYVNDG